MSLIYRKHHHVLDILKDVMYIMTYIMTLNRICDPMTERVCGFAGQNKIKTYLANCIFYA